MNHHRTSPILFSLFRLSQIPVQEGHDLTTGAGIFRCKLLGGFAGGDAIFRRPEHGIIAVILISYFSGLSSPITFASSAAATAIPYSRYVTSLFSMLATKFPFSSYTYTSVGQQTATVLIRLLLTRLELWQLAFSHRASHSAILSISEDVLPWFNHALYQHYYFSPNTPGMYSGNIPHRP